MGLIVLNGGLQTTLQAGARTGFRHMGVPASGPADGLSHALANRLVGNALETTTLEITLAGASFKFTANCRIALSGGEADIFINTLAQPQYKTLRVKSGDTLEISPLKRGARIYLAIEDGLDGDHWLGSTSTYLPAALGGYHGRALKTDDTIKISPRKKNSEDAPCLETPQNLRPHMGASWMLRATPGPEANALSDQSQTDFYQHVFHVSHRASRMGVELDSQSLHLTTDGRLPSAAVFPGTVQCPPSGHPFLLMADAQTTGGYPRIAHVIRADRHMLGQLRPGDQIQFRRTTPQEAASVLKAKTDLLRVWLGDTFQLG